MRTEEEMVRYCRTNIERQFFGFGVSTVLAFMPYDLAKEFLQDHVTKEKWREDGHPHSLTDETVLKRMEEYMSFAWEKAFDERGLSAIRSIERMDGWLWLLGNDDILQHFREMDSGSYCMNQLRFICEKFGFNIPTQ